MLSEKFAQTHNLQSTKYHVPGKWLSAVTYIYGEKSIITVI